MRHVRKKADNAEQQDERHCRGKLFSFFRCPFGHSFSARFFAAGRTEGGARDAPAQPCAVQRDSFFIRNILPNSIRTTAENAPTREIARSIHETGPNRNSFMSGGTVRIRQRTDRVPIITHLKAAFFSRSMLIPERTSERLERIIPRLQTTSVRNARALAGTSELS